MKLTKAHIREFWSILDSNQFDIGDRTCLVGKNESGKTAALQALYRLNPIDSKDGTFSVTDDYPRAFVTDYEKAVTDKKRPHANVIEATFQLEDEELKPVFEQFGAAVLSAGELTLLKGYANTLDFVLGVNETAAGSELLKKANLTAEVSQLGTQWSTLKELHAILNQLANTKAAEFTKAQAEANAMPNEDDKRKALAQAQLLQETEASKQLRNQLQTIVATGLSSHIFKTHLQPNIPQFLYFDEYYQMRGCENIPALQQRVAAKTLHKSDHPLLGLIAIASLKLEDLLNVRRTRDLKNKLEGASNYLSQKIIKYWSQNRYLRLEFDVREAKPEDPVDMRTGTNIWGSVHDSKHFVTTDLSSRSRGFVWFYSFLAWYTDLEASKRLILLLDEPGLSLHAKAQEDLLRFLEEQLKPTHQLIYTTHSPFMVDPKHFDRVRIVQDKSIESDDNLPTEEEGTKVITDVLDATQDSLFPLQGALGYEIYQTLFIGPNTLVVEGASDLLYIQAITGILQRLGKREALSSKWTITPVGGADKVPTFVALIGSQKNLNVATLIDVQKGHVQTVENLYKKKLLRKSHVLTFGDFTGKKESDIEDMFEREFYIQLLNAEFQKDLPAPVTLTNLNAGPPRILVSLEELLKASPLKGGVAFNHYRPARYFVENAAVLAEQLSPATLDRFEAAFKAVNKLLI
jgi:predicted ATP-binding protein involved in virulence